MDDSKMEITGVCNSLDDTRRELISTQEKYEDVLQENYELKKKIELTERVNIDLENELTQYNQENKKESSKCSKLLNELDSANERYKQLESLLMEEKLNFQRVLKESNAHEKKEVERSSVVPDEDHINVLTTHIHNLEMKQEEDKDILRVAEEEKGAYFVQIKQLSSEKQCLQNELAEVKEHLQNKTKDLRSANDSLESMREEKLLLTTQLEMLKASDTNASRGNSLFAEVEENRLRVAAQREVLKLKYINLKKVLSQKQVENNKLKLEIVKIRREEKDDDKNVHQDYSSLIKTYKERISELEKKVEQLQSNKPLDMFSKDDSLQWVSTVVENAKKESRTLQEELDRRSSNYVSQGHELFDSQVQNRKLKSINKKMQSEIDELRLKLDTIKSANEEVDDGISPPATDIAIAYQKQKSVKFAECLNTHNNTSIHNNSVDNKENIEIENIKNENI